MAIGFVEEKGNLIVVYDENSREISRRWKSREDEELLGYTASSFTVRCLDKTIVYDEHCREISRHWN